MQMVGTHCSHCSHRSHLLPITVLISHCLKLGLFFFLKTIKFLGRNSRNRSELRLQKVLFLPTRFEVCTR